MAGQYILETIEEAQEQATEWRWTYNNKRPNMGIGGMTPAMKLKTAGRILRLNPIQNGGITERGGGQPRFWHNGGSIILFKINPNAGITGRGDGPFDGHLVGGVKVEVDHRFAITVDGHIRVDFIRNIFAEFQRTAALF